MQNFWFIYSVDTITPAGKFETYGMIMDHEELHETVSDVLKSGTTIASVNVTMYDKDGEPIREKNITHLFVQGN